MTKELINTTPIEVTEGEAQLEYDIGDRAAGSYTIFATYSGTDNYTTAEGTSTLAVRIPTTITVGNTIASIGGEAVFTAEVKHHTNQLVTEGTVQFLVDGTNVDSPVEVDATGTATLRVTNVLENQFRDGAEITATYIRTSTYESSSTTVAGVLDIRDGTSVSLTNISGNRDETITINATITSNDGENTVNVNEGTAQLYIDNTVSGDPVIVQNGEVSFTYHIPVNAVIGGHTIKVAYLTSGDSSPYDPSESTATLTVRTPTVLSAVNVSGNRGATVPVTINVVDDNGTAIPSGTVSITIGDGEAQEAVVGNTGSATIQYNIPSDAEAGPISFTASFIEDDSYQASTLATAGVITVRKVAGIIVDSVQAVQGETITLSSTITDENGENIDEGTVNYEIE